ncbi:MAG TPA: hypothetical protein VH079_05660 [Terriglobales bacterium]|nr:hypothetical protein [Terriglobales bacterium]
MWITGSPASYGGDSSAKQLVAAPALLTTSFWESVTPELSNCTDNRSSIDKRNATHALGRHTVSKIQAGIPWGNP